MTSIEVATFTAETSMPLDTAEQVSSLFAFNYPTSHSQADRESDTIARINGNAVLQILDSGKTLYVASSLEEDGPTIAGFIEASTRDVPDGTYEIMTWLMTAAEYRGRHVASLLHRTFILEMRPYAPQNVLQGQRLRY